MTLKEQVCNLECAKELKKLGVKQRTSFWWEQAKLAGKNEWQKEWKLAFNNFSAPYDDKHVIPAFTVAELGELLPIQIDAKVKPTTFNSESLSITKGHFNAGLQWQVMYYDVHFENASTEADARAKMLIYLLKHKLI